MRIPVPALLLALFLGGCALPPAITVVSLVADGVSYVATGKSTTDHAISAVAREDCALLRVVRNEAICDPDGEVLFAMVGADESYDASYFDPENGSPDPDAVPRWGAANELEATVEPAPEQPPQLSVASIAPETLGETTTATPALTPGPISKGKSLSSRATAIAVAAKPSPRGLFADARPSPRPQDPQLRQQAISWFTRLTQ